MAGSSPTSRTLAECRKRGWRAQVVERWVPMTHRRIDLFGFIDIVALDGQPGVLGIQATSGSSGAARVTKMRTECSEALAAWLGAGNRAAVWTWAKRGKAGKRKVWTLREVDVNADKGEGR